MSHMDEKQLGRRLQLARQTAGMTQQALCQKAGLSYSTLAKIERGAIKTPSVFTIQSIAAALGTTLDELVGVPAAPHARSRSRSGVRFVYFDLNNCIVRNFNRAFNKIAAECDLPSDIVETFFWQYNDAVCRSDITLDEFNAKLGKELNLPRFDWRSYYLETIEAVPHMDELLHWVHEHYGIGLLTNSMTGFIKDMQTRGVIPDVKFDAIIDSSEVRFLKPEREIYELAQKAAHCAPEEILFTDDTRANLMAAQRLGWHVMLFDDSRPGESVQRLRAALEIA